MPQTPPIADAYIDDIIKAQEAYDPTLNKTQGVKLRELIKLMRDRLEQEIADTDPLKGLTLSSDQSAQEIYLKNGEGTTLATLSVAFLNNEGTSFDYNATAKTLELKNDANELLASVPVGDFVSNFAKSLNFNTATPANLELKDNAGNVLSTVSVTVNNISGLQVALDTKLTGTLATDPETQITDVVPEDTKLISRLKLFNWWAWIKSQAQSVTGAWKFGNSVTLATGTSIMPPLIIPPGTLTTTPVNGAIERDANGLLWTTFNGVRSQLVSTRFSKNISRFGTNFFVLYNSVSGDVIPAGTLVGNGNIYPPLSYFNSNSQMVSDDIIESSFIVYRASGPATNNYVFRVAFYITATSGGTPAIESTYDYNWDIVAIPALSIKIIFTKRSDLTAYGYLISFVVLINGVFVYSTPSFYSWDSADCRLYLVNNNAGTNTIVFNQYEATNVFIPYSIVS